MERVDRSPDTPPNGRARLRKLAFAAFVLVYFLYFNRGALKVHFAPDDMMNLDYYYHVEPWRMLLHEFMIWAGYFRPMAAFFYLPIFYVWHLNPVPYEVFMLALMLANVYLVYRFARLLGCEAIVAGVAALIAAYHPGLMDLYYNTAFVYDVLCMFFYLAAFGYYLRLRPPDKKTPPLLTGRQTLAFLALYYCALNSKEMAVTLPVMMLVYEWIYRRPKWLYREPDRLSVRDLAQWLAGPGRVALAAALLNLPFIYGKFFGPEAMTKMPGYQPVFSMVRFLDYQNREKMNFLLRWPYTGWMALAVFWLVLLYLALRRPRPILVFCLIFMILTPVPIEFLEGRGGACLAIPLAVWAIFAATIFVDVARALAGFLAGEPGLRRVGRERLAVVAIAAGVLLMANEFRLYRESDVVPGMKALGQTTAEVIRQFKLTKPHVRPHSQVVFLNDPFQDWDMAFIGDLWFRDHTLHFVLQRKTPLTPDELARADYQFDYRDGKLVQVK
jgi:hypothetical protein